MKAQPNYHQGIEYIRLSAIPFFQYQKFISWISPLSIFQINKKDTVIDDCVLYSEYDCWYELNVKDAFVESSYSF